MPITKIPRSIKPAAAANVATGGNAKSGGVVVYIEK